MLGADTLPLVRRYGLVCLVLVGGMFEGGLIRPTLAAQQSTSTPANDPNKMGADQRHQPDTTHVAPDAPVVTIKGLCRNQAANSAAVRNCG